MHGPWKSKALRRFWTKYREIPEGVAQEYKEPWESPFLYAPTKDAAKKLVADRVRDSFSYVSEFLKSPEHLELKECQVSDEEWAAACDRFQRGEDFKLP